jgi:hypothetical protein
MRIAAGLVKGVAAIKSGLVVDEHGRKHEINAGTTCWSRASPELRDPVIASYFGLSVASDGFPRSRAVVSGTVVDRALETARSPTRPASSDRPSWYLR